MRAWEGEGYISRKEMVDSDLERECCDETDMVMNAKSKSLMIQKTMVGKVIFGGTMVQGTLTKSVVLRLS